MRKYDELSPEEQTKAINVGINKMLEAISNGVRFNDELNGDGLQERIDQAIARADEMQTPWFASEYIMDTCGDEIRGMASCNAEEAFYPDDGDRVIDIR